MIIANQLDIYVKEQKDRQKSASHPKKGGLMIYLYLGRE